MISSTPRAVTAASLPAIAPNSSSADGVLETPLMRERALASMREALRLIPNAEKAEYLQAVQRAPHLVQRESNPLAYLRFVQFDSWAAAKRLAFYWKNRVALFPQRAFLPLTLLPGGALNEEDLEALRMGYLSLLPNDAAGRSVCCYDPSKRTAQVSNTTRLRLGFYLGSVMSQNPVTQKQGFVMIVILGRGQAPGSSNSIDGTTRVGVDLLLDSFPARHHAIHVVYAQHSSTNSFWSFVFPLIFGVLGRLLQNHRAHFHFLRDQDLVHKFAHSYGIFQLPVCLGGSVPDGDAWIQERRLVEQQSQQQQQQQPVPQVPQERVLQVQQQKRMQQLLQQKVAPAAVPTTDDASRVHEAMKRLPLDKTAPYQQAMKKAPELVDTESNPAHFLQVEDNDVWKAATRLAEYWQIRLSIFGPRHAFLPLHQTMEGALDRSDVATLHTGFWTQLPNGQHGQTVLFCDGRRLQKSSRSSRRKCTFYMWKVASENPVSRTRGYQVLYALTEPSFDRAIQECLQECVRATPVILESFVLVGTQDAKETLKLLGPSVQARATCVPQQQDLASEHYGLVAIPKSLGGNWGYQDFVQWQEFRIRCEWDLPIGSGTRDAARGFNMISPPKSEGLSEEDKLERKRRMNVIHSRRKRQRERIEVEGLNEQCMELKGQQDSLVREGEHLEALLQQADRVIADSHR